MDTFPNPQTKKKVTFSKTCKFNNTLGSLFYTAHFLQSVSNFAQNQGRVWNIRKK